MTSNDYHKLLEFFLGIWPEMKNFHMGKPIKNAFYQMFTNLNARSRILVLRTNNLCLLISSTVSVNYSNNYKKATIKIHSLMFYRRPIGYMIIDVENIASRITNTQQTVANIAIL